MNKVFFVIGPSGSGKTTLVDNALNQLGEQYNLVRIPSCITREQRLDEINGSHFFFVRDVEFDYHIKYNNFIEWEKYAGFRHGLLKDTFKYLIKNNNLIKEITPNGIPKIKGFMKNNYINAQIIIISIGVKKQDIINRLHDRGVTEQEIEDRQKSDKLTSNNIIPDHYVYNFNSYTMGDPKENFNRIIKSYFKSDLESDLESSFDIKKINTKVVNNMIKVHNGFTVISHPSNSDKRYVHITVDSEKSVGVVYYVTVDRLTGKLLGCSCPQSAMFPFVKCKHQRAVVEQRLLGD